ncbi:hypothetical protein E2C01_087598 [Portunus trituberculatus]|uniref:Uncharacterized protein n=1 Tax=Portunus trituberculatus TaxID=210409 RepID=A0A5B7JEG9_PORTR|nr:hypothetical protein [Portunus trituberculatus]
MLMLDNAPYLTPEGVAVRSPPHALHSKSRRSLRHPLTLHTNYTHASRYDSPHL